MKSSITDFMKRGAQAIADCYHALDDEEVAKKAAPISVAPGATHLTDVSIPKAGAICEVTLKFEGGQTVDFAVFQRNEYEAYKAGRRDLLVPVTACKEVSELRSARILLDGGEYVASVHN